MTHYSRKYGSYATERVTSPESDTIRALRADLDRKNTLLALQTDRLNELNKSVVNLGADFDEAVDRAAYFHDLLSTATQEITRLREALKEIRQYAINCQNDPYVTAMKDPVACPYWIQEKVDATLENKYE